MVMRSYGENDLYEDWEIDQFIESDGLTREELFGDENDEDDF
ncbi:hypothetical protein FACS1894195_0560 [Bacteroidia bacterium]|nr:hypothetical protein FACS1894195_0560 [Bacteroidia bacterium]